MENEQIPTTTNTSSSSSSSSRQQVPQISVYSSLPDRQAVQVIQQALHRQPNTAAQYLQQMYAAQQQHLMLQTAALQQQHLSSAQLQSLAAVQQASLAANRQGSSPNGNVSQQPVSSQTTINLATSPAAAQLISRAQSVNSAAATGIAQQAVLLGNSTSPALTASQAQMYLRAQMAQQSNLVQVARSLGRAVPLSPQLIFTPTATVAAVQPEVTISSANQQSAAAQVQNLAIRSQQNTAATVQPQLQSVTLKATASAQQSPFTSQPKPLGPGPSPGPVSGNKGAQPENMAESGKRVEIVSSSSSDTRSVSVTHTATPVTTHPLITTGRILFSSFNPPGQSNFSVELLPILGLVVTMHKLSMVNSSTSYKHHEDQRMTAMSPLGNERFMMHLLRKGPRIVARSYPRASGSLQDLMREFAWAPVASWHVAQPAWGLGLEQANLWHGMGRIGGSENFIMQDDTSECLGDVIVAMKLFSVSVGLIVSLVEIIENMCNLLVANPRSRFSTQEILGSEWKEDFYSWLLELRMFCLEDSRGVTGHKEVVPPTPGLCLVDGWKSSGSQEIQQCQRSTQDNARREKIDTALEKGPVEKSAAQTTPLASTCLATLDQKKADSAKPVTQGKVPESVNAKSTPPVPTMTSGNGNATSSVTASVPQSAENKPPQAIVKPQILTHVIEGFVIQEGAEPFPVGRSSLLIENLAKQKQQQQQASVQPAEKLPQLNNTDSEMDDLSQQDSKEKEEDALKLKCEFCGRLDYAHKFKGSKRFCSMACAKRYNVGCSKRVGLFKPDKSKYLQKKEGGKLGRRGPRKNSLHNANKEQHKKQLKQPPANVGLSQEDSSRGSDNSSYEEPLSPISASSSSSRRRQSERELDIHDMRVRDPMGISHHFLPSDPTKWNVEDVCEFIRSLPGCQEIADEFRAQEIDGQALLLLKEDHLMSAMNIKLGPALKIYARINMLKDS
ncbi:polyhomeotic-like protein 2 [Carcharodon carcharias]|uniref:polyhomeotic-like protein 2 n=1 Tax=Carcharodon carcharias TaxID=13397 RepID=UPI001B7EACAE|nr:polyhomeotic-like protein 2 [Carcharodon carcharias]